MRRIFISIIAFYVVVESVMCSDLGKDGFNFYKDYLRSRNDDLMVDEIEPGERMIYFYRTPMQFYPGFMPALQEYKKRNENIFKNHMMTMSHEPTYPEMPRKRTSKTALSLFLHKLDPYYTVLDRVADEHEDHVLKLMDIYTEPPTSLIFTCGRMQKYATPKARLDRLLDVEHYCLYGK